jgi:hypothetical protein
MGGQGQVPDPNPKEDLNVKTRYLVVLALLSLALGLSAACSGKSVQTPTTTPRPTFTEAPTATSTPAATNTPIIPASPTPTETPASTATPVPPTATPVPPTATEAPATRIPPTAVPPTAVPEPQVGAHGVIGKLTLRDPKAAYGVGEQVFFTFEVTNPSGKDVPFGILGLKSDGNVQFQTSWTSDVYNHVFPANGVFKHDDNIKFGAPGTYTVKLAVCFNTYNNCAGGAPDWEEFAPGVVVTVH